MPTDAQREAIKRYQAAGKRATITLSMARATYDDINGYAATKGLGPAALARECIRRCMEVDGWTQPGANYTGADRTEQAQAETIAPGADHVEQVKRKRGRPRKVQVADMGANGVDAGAMVSHNNAQNNAEAVVADIPTQPNRKRGRPRKVTTEE